MATELAEFINRTPVIDSHEHMLREPEWVDDGPVDVLQDLFANYVTGDLISAGATVEAVGRVVNG